MQIGFDVSALCVTQSGVGTYVSNLFDALCRSAGLRVVPLSHCAVGPSHSRWLRSASLNKTVWMQLMLPWELRAFQFDLCHFTNGVAPISLPSPMVTTIHDMTLWIYPQYHYYRRLASMRPFMRIAAQRASAVIAVSENTKRDVERIFKLPSDKIHVVYEAVSPYFRPISNGHYLDSIRSQLNLPDRFVLYVGSIEPRKNLERLIHAVARLRMRGYGDLSLVIAGSHAWNHGNVFRAIEQTGLSESVCLVKCVPLEALVAVYNLAEVFVYPSLYEGFGLPVLEAMACGTPVVTSPRGSLREVAGNAAVLVDPTNIEQIADAIQNVIDDDDLRHQLREKGFTRAAAFSWEKAAVQTLDIYKEIAQDR